MGFSHVVLLNWKAADETISCLENVFAENVPAKFVVMDNASGDGSAEKIENWIDSNGYKRLSIDEVDVSSCVSMPEEYDIVLIRNSKNNGFAGGNNPGIRFAASRGRADIIWLLNSDARVDKNTFPLLKKRLDENPSLGFVGSVIRYYESPDFLQCFGGVVIHPRIGKCSLYKKNLHVSKLDECREDAVDCLMGASLAFRRELVEDLGVMEESYFMYAEEIDWQLRAKKRGWAIGVEAGSHIYHKGAQSTKGRSHMYHYYLNRASVMFSKRFYGSTSLLTVVPSLLSIVFLQNWKSPKSVIYGWKGVLAGAAFKW